VFLIYLLLPFASEQRQTRRSTFWTSFHTIGVERQSSKTQPHNTAGATYSRKAVPWLRRLVAGLPPRRPGFDPESVHVGFVVDKVAQGQVVPRVLRFPPVNVIPQFHSTGAPLLGKMKKLIIRLFIFITGLHNKPQGCDASVASAAGPFSRKKSYSRK
jgi:hypothetical protein